MSNSNASVVPDPFSDDPFASGLDAFAPLDTRGDGGSLADDLQKIADEDAPTVVLPATPAEPVAPAPKGDEPQVYQYDDGSSVTIEHGTKGWKATLDSNTGAPLEIFYGGTKDELLVNLSAGKMHATQKIRELNKKSKLQIDGDGDSQPVAPQVSTPFSGNLTADDIFALKTKLQDNPDEAFEEWFFKKTGMTVAQLAQSARTGKDASDELSAEAIAKDFIGRHPEYITYEKNFEALIAWLCKYKLGQPLNGRDPNALVGVLYNAGQFTSENLDEAYDDLISDGLLDLQDPNAEPEAPAEPVKPAAPVAPVAPAAPVTPPTNERIVREIRRPRAGLGIRTRETVGVVTPDESSKPPSVEELDNLSTGDIEKLLSDIRRTRLGTRR